MFMATDTAWAPWYVARSDDKRGSRLNVIRHLLRSTDYDEVPRTKVKLPKRQERGRYREPNCPYKLVPEKY
jgi:polyphosphate kinase